MSLPSVQPPSPKEITPHYEERLVIITGTQPSLSSMFKKYQGDGAQPDRVNLGLCEGQVKIEEEEAHLVGAVNSKSQANKLSIPAPRVINIPEYSCPGFKLGKTYQVSTMHRQTRTILRDLDDDDLRFSDAILRALELEGAADTKGNSKHAHREAWCHSDKVERQESGDFGSVKMCVSLPQDSVYSEDVLEWLLTVLDVLFPVKIRQILVTEKNAREAYSACRLVVLDAVELSNGLLRPPQCFWPPSTTSYMSRLAAERSTVEQNADSDASAKPGTKRRVCVNERLEQIAARVPFISFGLFTTIFSYFVQKRRSSPLIPCMRDRPYRDWGAPPTSQRSFLTQQEKRFPQQFCRAIKRAQAPLYYFSRMAEFVSVREAAELAAVTKECKTILAQIDSLTEHQLEINNAKEQFINKPSDINILPMTMERPANTYKFNHLTLNMYNELAWSKDRNQNIPRSSIASVIVPGAGSGADASRFRSAVEIFANVNGLQQPPEELSDEDIVNVFYRKIMALSA